MNETLILLVQLMVCIGLNLWLWVAVYDNWRHPCLNESGVAMVMRFDLMAREYPEDFRLLQHRRIDDPKIIRRFFYALVISETIAAITLSIGTLCLAAALFGLMAGDLTARTGTIGAAWGFHFANNCIAILIVVTQGSLTGLGLYRSGDIISALALTPLVVFELFALMIVWLLIRRVVTV